jgi:hypothetical protein
MLHRILGHVRHQGRPGWKRYGVGAGVTVVLAAGLILATGWGSAVAGQISNAFITNGPANPVPVQEQRTDANGNIKVHEQGTADVNVTNSSLKVGSPAPITDGGGGIGVDTGSVSHESVPVIASALDIHMSSDVSTLALQLGTGPGSTTPAVFVGPSQGAASDIVLPLSRPIKFDGVECDGVGTGGCSVTWTGAAP